MWTRVFALLSFVFIYALVRWGLKKTFPRVWERYLKQVVWVFSVCLCVTLCLMTTFGVSGVLADKSSSWRPWAIRTGFLNLNLILVVCAVGASMLIAFPLGWLARREARARSDGQKIEVEREPGRRRFIAALSALPPLGALFGIPIGYIFGAQKIRVQKIKLETEHPPLVGLKILHITDVHLGPFVKARDITDLIERVRHEQPDLVFLTGDLADDYTELEKTMMAIQSLGPRYGTWACTGNHEVYNGLEEAVSIMENAGIKVLRNRAKNVFFDDREFIICGIEDPGMKSSGRSEYYEESFNYALASFDASKPLLVLCHRPEGFEEARRHGPTFQFSGHTHGVQVGLFGRSAFQWLVPKRFRLAGYYAEDSKHPRNHEDQLYVSVGTGHWFPFRLGLPAEAVLYTIENKRT